MPTKGKSAKAIGTVAAGQVWIVKTASSRLAKVKLLSEGGSRRGRWSAQNLETGRQVEVKATGFVRRVEEEEAGYKQNVEGLAHLNSLAKK